MEFTLLWAALTGVVFAWGGTRLWPDRLPDHPLDRLVGAAAGGLIIGRLFAMITQGINPLTSPADIIIVRGGVSPGAATIGAVVAYLWSVKWKPRYLDATAPAVVLGMAGWHAGCVWRDSCLGTASSLPWAWAQSGSEITRHPVELYAAILLVGGAFLVSRLGWGLLTRSGAALAVVALVRLLTEPMRPSLGAGPIGLYAIGVLVGLAAMWVGPRLRLSQLD